MFDQNKINSDEVVTRYLFSKHHFSIDKKIVKSSAFYPFPKKDFGKISVFRIDDLSDDEIWKLGYNEVALKRQKDILARGDIKVNDIFQINLDIKPEHENMHIRHSNIIFPDDDLKSKELAAELALITELKL